MSTATKRERIAAAPTWACTASRSTTGWTRTCVTLEEYRRFRVEAERKGFRHFLEVFDPNAPHGLTGEQIPQFINDSIARTLAGVADGRPARSS